MGPLSLPTTFVYGSNGWLYFVGTLPVDQQPGLFCALILYLVLRFVKNVFHFHAFFYGQFRARSAHILGILEYLFMDTMLAVVALIMDIFII